MRTLTSDYIIIESIVQSRVICPCVRESMTRVSFPATEIEYSEYGHEFNFANISISMKISILSTLSRQILELHKLGFSVYGFGLEDILIIGGQIGILTNVSRVSSLDRDDYMMIMSPISPNTIFIDPIVRDIIVLPTCVHKNVSCYSMAVFLVYIIYGVVDVDLCQMIGSLRQTKIGKCIERCVDKDMSNRCVILF